MQTMSAKIKVLITGITGQIGYYVQQTYEQDEQYDVWGISRCPSSNSKIKSMDLRDKQLLENYILELQPDIIVHLAGISNLEECATDPIGAIETNGHVVVNLCEIIRKNKLRCKLFNASSSEIYKGHNNYTVREDDMNYRPNHPYGFSKLLAHSMIDYYRATYNLPFSNGIIYTTESCRRTANFLFKKVANHIKSWKAGNREPLTVGCLKSYRTLLHAQDVADAIKKIMECEQGATYLICGDEHICVENIILRMFELAQIDVSATERSLNIKGTADLIVNISGSLRGVVSSIHGDCQKLKLLGWSPKYSIDDICLDHLM
jgi:GDP-mannose 4,6-dehydratase